MTDFVIRSKYRSLSTAQRARRVAEVGVTRFTNQGLTRKKSVSHVVDFAAGLLVDSGSEVEHLLLLVLLLVLVLVLLLPMLLLLLLLLLHLLPAGVNAAAALLLLLLLLLLGIVRA